MSQEYVKQAIRTESDKFFSVGRHYLETTMRRVLEATRHLDDLKKAIFYGKNAHEFERGDNIKPDDLSRRQQRLLHAIIGKVTESAELLDLWLTDEMTYERMVDELGDGRWYDAIAMDVLGVDPATVEAKNIAKLQARYPDKFDATRGINPDKQNEQIAMDVV